MREFALPGTRPYYAPDRVAAVRHLKLELELDVPASRIAGTASLRLAPLVSGPTRLRLDAVELDVSEVRLAGRPVCFRNDGKNLFVELGPIAPGDDLDLAVDYTASPRRGLYFIAPDQAYPDKPVQVWSQGQDQDSRFWFPCLDQPSEKATSELIVTLPANMFALSNGRLLTDRVDGERRTMAWRFDVPHSPYLITLAAGEFSEIKDYWNGVEIAYYVEPGREDDCRRVLGRTPAMLDLFSRSFGVHYPYEKYAQVFVADFIFGGMENTTATTLTDVVLYDERAALDFDADSLVAHELAHQWFGDLLTCRSWGEGWLNEGFATYSEYIWREAAEGRDAADLELEEWAESYFGEDASRYRRVIATNVYDEPIDIFDHHLYEKGGRVLHMLRQHLGDVEFWRALRHYLDKHRAGTVETRDLSRAVEEVTGKNVDWFFDQWVVKGAGHPELEANISWDGERRAVAVAIKQTHKVEGQTPLFRLPLTLELDLGGEVSRHTLEVSEVAHSFFVPCDLEPRRAVLDPGKTMLAAIKTEKPLPMWIAELERAELAIDRRDAARQLAKLGGRKATRALIDALDGDRFWGVRAACADALAELRSDAAKHALLAALGGEAPGRERHPKARRAVVRALGKFRHDRQVTDTLVLRIQRGDPSYFVEAEACLSLGKTRQADAFDVLVAASSRDSFTDVIRQFAYRGLAELRDDRAVAILVEATRYGQVSHGRRAAVTALAELTRGRRDRVSRDARECITELLRDPDFRVQAAAIEGLAKLGDPAAIAALDGVAERELDGRLRRRAREVARDLGEARSRDEQVTSLRDEVDKLRGESAKLRERLDKLEAAAPAPTGTPAGRRDGSAAKKGAAAAGKKKPSRKAGKTAKKAATAARKPRRGR